MAPEDRVKFIANIAPKPPKTLNGKIKWLGIYDAAPLKTQLADKYLARQCVQERWACICLSNVRGNG